MKTTLTTICSLILVLGYASACGDKEKKDRRGSTADGQQLNQPQVPQPPQPGENGFRPITTNNAQIYSFENLGLSANRMFTVPQGMRVVRYATNNSLRGLKVVELVSSDPNLRDLNFGVPVCETKMIQTDRGSSIPVYTQEVQAISYQGGTPANYCYYQPTPELFQDWTRRVSAENQIDVASEPGQPFAFTSAAVFPHGSQEVTSTRRLFTEQCGRPIIRNIPQTNETICTSNPTENTPNGVYESGTCYNLPVGQGFFGNTQSTTFHWCMRNISTGPLGAPLGEDGRAPSVRPNRKVYVGTFELARWGSQNSDKLEYHRIVEPTGQIVESEFALEVANDAINAVRPVMAD